MMKIFSATFLLISFFANPASADIFDWHSTNIQLLRGWNFELGEPSRSTVSLQHSNKWRYGDTYAFIDIDESGDAYAEIHPRLSLGKITGKSLAVGPIADIFVASTFEFAPGANRRLFGFGFDWKIPGFSYLKTNFYTRNNPSLAGSAEQVTVSWGLPVPLGKHRLFFDGFADITGVEGTRVANEQVQAGALIDIGHYWGQPNKFFIGTEYIYWNNKFGLDGVRESVFQIELRYVL